MTADAAGETASRWSAERPLDVYLVAGEVSGDHLGAKLMRALRETLGDAVSFRGVGGPAMEGQGLASLFPLGDIAVMGFLPVLKKLPQVLSRIRQTAGDVVSAKPDVLVIIDSPDFTHRVARKVRAQNPAIPIVDYVSPTVWAWRPGRAAKMRAYVDRLLAILPFEPRTHAELGGPPCTYVGHPLIERLGELRPDAEEAKRRHTAPPVLLVLPGSRRSEIERLCLTFGETVSEVSRRMGALEIVLPAVDHLAGQLRALTEGWKVKPRIVTGEAEKLRAFRNARAALAASGTVTLELALSGIPSVVAYKVAPVEMAIARRLVRTKWITLPNIILDEEAFPEFLQDEANPQNLSSAICEILPDGPARYAQLAALQRLENRMKIADGQSPSHLAAQAILQTLSARGPQRGAA